VQLHGNHVKWKTPATLYLLDVSGFIQIDSCTNWDEELKKLRKEMGSLFKVIKTYDFENYWRCELIERVAKFRMKRWWYEEQSNHLQIPVQLVVACVGDTKKVLSPEYMKFSTIHKKPSARMEHYRQIAEMYFQDEG